MRRLGIVALVACAHPAPAPAPPVPAPPSVVAIDAGTGNATGAFGEIVTVPGVEVGQPVITGKLDKAAVRRHIKRHLREMADCYEHVRATNASLEGGLTVTFVIGADGKVTASSATGFDGAVASCIAAVVATIQFPASGDRVEVTYPFRFDPAGT